MDVKNLISALTNKEVIETLSSVIQPIIAQAVACVINDMNGKIEELQQENSALKENLRETSQRLDLLETYTRVDNLIIKGLPEVYAEAVTVGEAGPEAVSSDTTLEQVLHFVNTKLNVSIDAGDISATHRLPKGNKDKYKPIIVRFKSHRLRDTVYRARRNLRILATPGSESIYINEHLTKVNEHTFAHCRKLWKDKKVSGTWTWHGITYVKLKNGSIKKSFSRMM